MDLEPPSVLVPHTDILLRSLQSGVEQLQTDDFLTLVKQNVHSSKLLQRSDDFRKRVKTLYNQLNLAADAQLFSLQHQAYEASFEFFSVQEEKEAKKFSIRRRELDDGYTEFTNEMALKYQQLLDECFLGRSKLDEFLDTI